VPPLRDRGEDIVLLAEYFLAELNADAEQPRRFAAGCLARFRTHRWPGNVRELKDLVERASILTDGDLDVDVPAAVDADPAVSGQPNVGSSLSESERELILATLEHFEGDKKRAAAMLKISLNTLYSRLREYKLD
jgi:two-component system, NtrC family, response regulator HydG